MKRNALCLVAAAFLSAPLSGQEAGQPVIRRSAAEWNTAQSLWFASANAAGLTIHPLRDYNIVSAAYHQTSGAYKLQQDGDRDRQMAFNTNGAIQLGKLALWGNFSFSDDMVTGSRYNTNRYEPAYDMPYYVADTLCSDWKKQYYDMSLKAAFPLLPDRLALGADLHYTAKKGAKQIDPRSVVFSYNFSVAPSVTLKLTEQHQLGLNGLYTNLLDRNTFTNSVTFKDQNIFLMKGLGMFSKGVVGGQSSIGMFYYPGHQYGSGLQYGFSGKRNTLLAEINYTTQKIDVFEQPSKPRRRGTTGKSILRAGVQLLRSGSLTQKLSAELSLANTNGIEYVQEYRSDYEINQWVTLAEYIKSTYQKKQATITYDLFATEGDDYRWRAGIQAGYLDRQDEYLAPNARFSTQNTYVEAYGKKNVRLRNRQHLLLGLNLKYNANLSGDYRYAGADTNSPLVTDFYPKDLAYLSANYLRIGGEVDWSLPITAQSTVNIALEWQWEKPTADTASRTYLGTSISYRFP
jgi:hypothetical protein